MKYIQGQNREQLNLFPVSLDHAIGCDHEIRLIDAFVDGLKLGEFGFQVNHDENGRPAYHPSDLLKLYMYGYLNRMRSSRILEKECGRNIEVMWLLKALQPDHNTISNFRRDNPKAIKKVFRETVKVARYFNLIGGTLLAGDSTKLRAQNSKKNNFNQKKIDRHLEYIENKLTEYNKSDDCYTCPQGQILTTTDKWHKAKTYKFKRYTTKACITCDVKDECSKAKYGKGIQRSEYQELIEGNKKRVKQNENYYKRRQAIVEHPYGTIKRQWGFDHIMTKKTRERASADVGLIMTAYNLRRLINIIGLRQLVEYMVNMTVYLLSFSSFTKPKSAHISLLHQITSKMQSIFYNLSNQLYLTKMEAA